MRRKAFTGVWDHWGWAVLVTVTPDGRVVDRRRIELIDDGLPPYPHHHDALRLPGPEGVALVERVQAAVRRRAAAALDAFAGELAVPIGGIAIRACPALPATIAERLVDYRAQNVADSVMYREALADAARARDWAVCWYEEKALRRQSSAAPVRDAGKALGPPWTKDHRVAMAAALAAAKP